MEYISGKGSSKKGETHREHAVPCKIIRDHCFTLFRKGAQDTEVALFIKEHLKIVHITKDECDRLDHLGLRYTMPEGWEPGCDPMARIAIASISTTPISG